MSSQSRPPAKPAATAARRTAATRPLPKDQQSQRKHLRALGHHLKPVVTIAERGLTEGVEAELERALQDHELIKVKLALAEPDSRRELAQALCEQHGAELVQQVGKVILIYRAASNPNPRLSNLLRPL